MKGAPEKILNKCQQILLPDGQIVELTKDTLQSIEDSVS